LDSAETKGLYLLYEEAVAGVEQVLYLEYEEAGAGVEQVLYLEYEEAGAGVEQVLAGVEGRDNEERLQPGLSGSSSVRLHLDRNRVTLNKCSSITACMFYVDQVR
jgi:hypothetical protein